VSYLYFFMYTYTYTYPFFMYTYTYTCPFLCTRTLTMCNTYTFLCTFILILIIFYVYLYLYFFMIFILMVGAVLCAGGGVQDPLHHEGQIHREGIGGHHEALHVLPRRPRGAAARADPEAPEKMPEVGDYVEVQADSIKDLQKCGIGKRYVFDGEDAYILTLDYEQFQEAHTHTHTHTRSHTHSCTHTPPPGHERERPPGGGQLPPLLPEYRLRQASLQDARDSARKGDRLLLLLQSGPEAQQEAQDACMSPLGMHCLLPLLPSCSCCHLSCPSYLPLHVVLWYDSA
jgi:hypothetical protein